MIQQETLLKVADNSGAKIVKCIKVLGGFQKKYAKLGDTLVVSVQHLKNKLKKNSKVKKKDVYRALLVRTKTKLKKKTGFEISFKENSVILLNKSDNLVGTRIIGPVLKALKKKMSHKTYSVASGFIS